MQLSVKGKQIDIGDALRRHVEESLETTTGKYFSDIVAASVVFSREAHLFRADIQVHAGRNILMQSNGAADDPYRAFDAAAGRMATRLRRYKRRLDDHHRDYPAAPPIPAQAFILQAEPEQPTDAEEPDQPIVIAEMEQPIDTLTVSQAVMRMDLGDLPALMFRNSAHGALNMVYRRADGNIGWVDPRDPRETA